MKLSLLLTSTAIGGALLASPPASAQDVPAPAAAAETGTPMETIVVTGTRIARPNIESPVPIIAVPAEELTNSGSVSLGDALNDLPALRSTFSQSNSTRFIGTAGLNILDLRGLGTERTLVLVNGRRHVPSTEGTSEVDINSIPVDLLERTEVITGANSAIYGSDAIAGVVNFITKRDFEGLQLRAQGGISSRHDAGSYFISGTFGQNFADDRGNIAVNVEYAKQRPFFFKDRRTTRTRGTFVTVDSDPPGSPNGSDGEPDRIFVPDTRSAFYSLGGTFAPFCDETLVGAARDLQCRPGTDNGRLFHFQPNGSLIEADYGTRDFRPLSSSTSGGSGASFRDYGHLQPDVERITVNLLAHYDISDAFRPYVEAKYVRNNVFAESSPSFDNFLFIGFDNAYLSPEAAALIQARQSPEENALGGFFIARDNPDFGVRNERIRRETYRIVAGVEGTFNDDWRYDISVNYGEYKKCVFSGNNQYVQRYLFAADAVIDPATGNPVCRVTIDPAARVSVDPSNPAFDAALADDVAQCQPLNVLGAGNASAAALNYAFKTSRSDGKATQFVVNGFMSGDLSDLFELPGGPVGFAIGGEYRRETAREEYDADVRAGLTFLNAIPIFDPPTFEVKELFGELRIPLLADMPFAKLLTINAAARFSDYKGAVGNVFTWNIDGVWAPIEDIRFRAGYGKSVRSPNLSESFSSPTQNFDFVDDPCDIAQIGGGSATRAANCAAAGVPAGFINTPTRQETLEITSAGNPDLREESSKSFTVGGIFQPRFLPGFALSVDYFDIKINDVIASVAPQDVLNNCYDAADLNNVFCTLFERDPVTHFFVPGSLQDTSLNFARRRVRGIDADISYRRDIGGGQLGLHGIVTYTIQRDNFPFIDDPTRPDQILHELGDPEWAFTLSADYRMGGLSLGYQLRYIGKMLVSPAAENIFTVGGRPPQNADYAEVRWYPDVFYHDIRVAYDITDRFNLYFGVDNIGDRLPPFGLTAAGEGSGIYDIRGRFLYAGVKAKF